MQIRCLTDTHVIDVKPPLTIIYVGNGCEAYSSNIFIPAKSELTSKVNTAVRHTYFQQFNEDYQNITRYSLTEDLELIKLTKKEIENLPDCLTALPNLQFKELKRRLVEIKKPFNMYSNISFILVMELMSCGKYTGYAPESRVSNPKQSCSVNKRGRSLISVT